MKDMQLPGAEAYYSQIEMHTSTANTNISLAKEFQKHISDPTQAHCLLNQSKDKKCSI